MIYLEEKYLDLVRKILSDNIGKNVNVFVFGSRVKGNNKKYSDLDLAIDGNIDDKVFVKLKNEFQESNLPIKVDVILLNKITKEFYNAIKNDLVKIN